MPDEEHDEFPDPRREPTMDVERAARFLGLSRTAAYAAVQNGEIPSVRIGRRLRVQTAALARMLGLDDDSYEEWFGPAPTLGTPAAAKGRNQTPTPPAPARAHRGQIVHDGNSPTTRRYQARCSCGWKSQPSHQLATIRSALTGHSR